MFSCIAEPLKKTSTLYARHHTLSGSKFVNFALIWMQNANTAFCMYDFTRRELNISVLFRRPDRLSNALSLRRTVLQEVLIGCINSCSFDQQD